MMRRKARWIFGSVAVALSGWAGMVVADTKLQRLGALRDCAKVVGEGFRPIGKQRSERFLGKVQKETANCRGGQKALKYMGTPWVDWQNYWAAGDETTKAGKGALTALGEHLKANGRGIDGALIDLEYQRIELVTFNLFDNKTYEDYVTGRDGVDGPALKEWAEMRLPQDDPNYREVGGDGKQQCKGQLIRHRNLTGTCNDLKNPLMGSTNTPFARNVQFETTFPDLGKTELVRNRHGDRLSMLKPDPQVISRKLFTRKQSQPGKCNEGNGLPDFAKDAQCDYKPAPFFNVLAAFWIQFMTHDWFSHLKEGHNDTAMVGMGCATQRVNNEEKPLSDDDVKNLKCRPADKIDATYYAETAEPRKFSYQGKEHLARAHKTTANTVTAWWDASQIYGYDESSRRRVKRDPSDTAKLLMVPVPGDRKGQGERYGYLPSFKTCPEAEHDCVPDPINAAWAGQEATAFPDNWTIGMSFYHNVFVREHNLFVEEFRKRAAATPDGDCGMRNPDQPDQIISYKGVTPDELFEAARLVVSAEIAKIHTIEWTPQLLYGEPLYLGMNSNWFGLLKDHKLAADALERVVGRLARSADPKKANAMYSVFASGPGIFGLGNGMNKSRVSKPDPWDLKNLDNVNRGINHFGSPFNFPEEFTTVYRLHTMVPDLIEYREWGNAPNSIRYKVPIVQTFRGKATDEMRKRGLANWAISMGRQRLGLLWLHNHAQFLQNVPLDRLSTTGVKIDKIDVPALDLIRDRERGVPRFNEFRRQYGLKTLTGFDDFIDQHVPAGSSERGEQEALVKALREVYGQHRCDASKVITDAQVNADGSPINDCLGHPDGSMVDNVEDVDTVVGWLAERTRPHGYAISETQFQVFILNASRRLFSDRFFTSSFRPEFYSQLGVAWVNDNGPNGKVMEKGEPNGHRQEISPLKRILLRTMPELTEELGPVVNAFDPWARDRGLYYSLQWKPRSGAESDEAF